MTTVALEVIKRIHSAVEDALDEAGCLQTCLHCKHFDEQTEICAISNPKARPPARVIVFGCAAFEDKRPD